MYVNFKTTLPALLLAGCFAPLSATHAAIINDTFTVSNLSGSNGTAALVQLFGGFQWRR